MDYSRLAELTKGYNCSDISYIIKLASRKKFNESIMDVESKSFKPITQALLEEVIASKSPSVSSRDLKEYLTVSLKEHRELDEELQELLDRYGDEGKAPNPVAKSMSWMKTAMKLQWDESDATIAELMTDGCHMGVKSLSRYLNQYAAADETSKHICKTLIIIEDRLGGQMRAYL